MVSFLIFLFSTFSSAQSMNLGFYNQNSPEIPPLVMQARSKIFKIKMPYYIQLQEQHYEGMLAGPNIPTETKQAVMACQGTHQTSCIVPFAQIEGTAFLDRSPEYVWTNCHIVYDWMRFAGRQQTFTQSQEVRQFFSRTQIPLVLTSSETDVVYSGVEEEAFLEAFMTQSGSGHVESSCGRQDDLVKIKLSRPLASEGLSWHQGSVQGTLYMGGFPRPTESRQPLGFQDSDGKRFFWSMGVSMNFKNADDLIYLNQKPHMGLILASSYGAGLLADGVEGMSGAPVLNESGGVVGIYKGFVPLSEEERDIPFVSLYINLQGMRFVEIISGNP